MTDQLFASSGFAPDGFLESPSGDILLLSRVPCFLRTLLTADGTVTKGLESFFWERVNVGAVRQSMGLVEDAQEYYLDVERGDEILVRDVELRGESSGIKYLDAHSVFAVKHLPHDIFSDLKLKNIGIGELLRECGLETYRKIVAMGLSDQHKTETDKTIWRAYVIYIQGQAAIQIREEYRLSVFVGK